MNYISFFPRSCVGLDVQADGVRLVKMKQTQQAYRVECLAGIDLHEQIFAEGKIKRWDILQPALRELSRKYHLNGLPAVIAVPAGLVRMQRIQLPVGMAEEAIEEEIYLHVQRDLPGISDALSIDYHLQDQGKSGYVDVCFAAARSEYLSQYAACVNDGGFQVKIVDIESYALKRMVSDDIPSSGAYAIAYFTNKKAILTVFGAHEMIHHHEWEWTEDNDICALLKHHIDSALIVSRIHIQRLIVCGLEKAIANIRQDKAQGWAYDMCFHQPFSQVTFADEAAGVDASSYLIAGGLAMQAVPRW